MKVGYYLRKRERNEGTEWEQNEGMWYDSCPQYVLLS
jgi:hypothetical protein